MKDSLIAFAAAALCGVLALAEFHSLWPYQLSKWVLCAVALWLAARNGATWRRGCMCVVAVLFNPIAPIRFGAAWVFVDWVAAMAFVVASPTSMAARVVRFWGWWFFGPPLRVDVFETIREELRAQVGAEEFKRMCDEHKKFEDYRESAERPFNMVYRWLLTGFVALVVWGYFQKSQDRAKAAATRQPSSALR